MIKIAVRALVATVVLAVPDGPRLPARDDGASRRSPSRTRPTVPSSRSNGKTVGSSLIGQKWNGDRNGSTAGRPRSTTTPPRRRARTSDRRRRISPTTIADARRGDHRDGGSLPPRTHGRRRSPSDLLTASAAGSTPTSARRRRMFQVPRIAAVTRPLAEEVPATVQDHVQGRDSRVPRRASRERARAQPGAGALGVAVIDVVVRDRIVARPGPWRGWTSTRRCTWRAPPVGGRPSSCWRSDTR